MKTVCAIALCLALAATTEAAAILDLEAATVISGLALKPYSEDGFTLSSAGEFFVLPPANYAYTGSIAFTPTSTTNLVQNGGGAFALRSIDLAVSNWPMTSNITFTGQKAGGGTATFSISVVSTSPTLQTFSFGADFSNVTSVSWVSSMDLTQFDNVKVESLSTVPKPASMTVLSIGLAGLSVRRWRQRRNG